MTWGRARNLIGVHWFDAAGSSLCRGAANGNHLRLRWPIPVWDPDHEDTCEVCRVLRHDEEIVDELIARLRAEKGTITFT